MLRELCAKAGGAWITCVGSSMEPTIARGDRVRVVAIDRVRVGDVVLFEAGDHFVMHRILARLGSIYVHAGDAGTGTPAIVRAHRVMARVLTPRRRVSLGRQLSACAAALARSLASRLA